MTRWTIERVGLLLAVVTLLTILARPSLALQDAEATMNFSENAVRTGASLSMSDALLALNTIRLDGDSRPRVISYFAYIVTVKTRLWLWQFVTPHPSVSPVWLLTLVAAPLLLFRTLRHITGARAAAVGVAMYMLSPGNLSGAVLFFHPGKPLAAVLLITALWLCVRIRMGGVNGEVSMRAGGWPWMALTGTVAIAPFVDEAAVFVALVPVVWLWPYFRWSRGRRSLLNWCWLIAPLVLAAGVIFVAAPLVSSRAIGYRFDMVRYLDTMSNVHRLDVEHFLWQVSTLFGAHLVPWSTSHIRVPVTEGTSMWWQAWVAIAVLGVVVRRALARPPFAPVMRRVLILAGLFIALQTVVFVVHDFELVATSFYYGSSFSVLFAMGGAVLYASVTERADGRHLALARVAVAAVCVMCVVNVLQLADSWRSHIAAKQMIFAKYSPPTRDERLADWQPLITQAFTFLAGPDLADGDTRQSYTTAPAAIGWRESREIVQRWRGGSADILAGQPVTSGNAWIVRELELARRLQTTTMREPIFK